MNKFFPSSFLYLIGEGVSKGAIFVITPIIINTYGGVDFGSFSLFISYIPFLSVLFDLGQRSSVKRFYIDAPDEIDTFINVIQLIPVLNLILLILIKEIFQIDYELFYFLIINSFLFALIELHVSKFQIEKKAFLYNIVFVLRNAAPYYLFILATLFFSVSLHYFYIIQAVAFSIIILFLKGKTKINFHFSPRRSISYFKKSLQFSLPILPAVLSGIVLNVSDRYIIQIFYGEAEVGIYSLAYSVGSIFFVFITAMNKSWQTFILNALKQNERKKIRSVAHKYILLALFVVTLVFFSKRHIILLLSNKDFLPAAEMINYILGGMFFYFLYTIYSNVAFYYKDTFLFSLPAIIAAILNIFLNFLIIPKLGFEWAAITTLASYFIEFLIIYLICKFRYKFSLL